MITVRILLEALGFEGDDLDDKARLREAREEGIRLNPRI